MFVAILHYYFVKVKQVVLLCKVALLQYLKVLSSIPKQVVLLFSRYLLLSKPATFIAHSMSINPRKWYLVYSIMLTNFKKVILSVRFRQSYTIYKQLIFS